MVETYRGIGLVVVSRCILPVKTNLRVWPVPNPKRGIFLSAESTCIVCTPCVGVGLRRIGIRPCCNRRVRIHVAAFEKKLVRKLVRRSITNPASNRVDQVRSADGCRFILGIVDHDIQSILGLQHDIDIVNLTYRINTLALVRQRRGHGRVAQPFAFDKIVCAPLTDTTPVRLL